MLKYTKLLAWMLMIILAFGVMGCSDDEDGNNNTGPSTTNYFDDVAELGFTYFNDYSNAMITAQVVFDNMMDDVPMLIIDWRAEADYAAGHIAGAVNWRPADLVDNLDQLPTSDLIVNVCYSGQSASQITAAMHLLGYDNARNMGFGMCSWTARDPWLNLVSDGFALETDAVTMTETYDYPTALDMDAADLDDALRVRIDEYLTGGTKNKSAVDVYGMLEDDEEVFVLNYWPEAQYLAGHVPGAFQMDPKTWDMAALAKLPTDKPIVVYCYTGQTSSQVTLWLRVLGYDAYSLLFGMNKINNTHPNNVNYTAPGEDKPVVTE